MEKRKDWLIITAIAAIVFAVLSLILMVKLNSTLGELKELKVEKREAWKEVMNQKEENAADTITADEMPGEISVRLMDGMVQQKDSLGEWTDICTIQEFEQSDPVSMGRQKMEEIVRQHQEAEANGTAEENSGLSVASLKGEIGLTVATQEITVNKQGTSADKSAGGSANDKKNKRNNGGQTGQETGQTGTQTPAGGNTTSSNATPSAPTPSNPTPAQPTNPTPTQPSTPTPAEPTPSDPAPADPTPVEPAPSEPAQQPDAGSGDGEDIGWTDGVL